MDFEFDPAMDEANKHRHGFSLAFGIEIFADENHLVLPTIRTDDEEERFKAIGLVSGKLHTAIHVWRGEIVRFISVRRSNDNERRAYEGD
jgi:uncharacterized DUF497 family protein